MNAYALAIDILCIREGILHEYVLSKNLIRVGQDNASIKKSLEIHLFSFFEITSLTTSALQ
jgi:hypothetical protein